MLFAVCGLYTQLIFQLIKRQLACSQGKAVSSNGKKETKFIPVQMFFEKQGR